MDIHLTGSQLCKMEYFLVCHMANNFCLDFLMIDFSGSFLIIDYLAWQDHSALGTTLFFM